MVWHYLIDILNPNQQLVCLSALIVRAKDIDEDKPFFCKQDALKQMLPKKICIFLPSDSA
jgi:hypothetical protein